MADHNASLSDRARQALTIAAIELRRVFFARRGLWIYGLALLPSLIFVVHGVTTGVRRERLTRGGLTDAALLDTVRDHERIEAVRQRLGKPAEERWSVRSEQVRRRTRSSGTTVHPIDPAVSARFVRLNIAAPSYTEEWTARIYEFEVYGPGSPVNLALGRPVTGSLPCRDDRGPEKAVNGSVAGGEADSWCSTDRPFFLQVDLDAMRPVSRFVVRHASAGGERDDRDTRVFNIQVSPDGKVFTTVQRSTGGFVEARTEYRNLVYFDGQREAWFQFVDGTLGSVRIRPLASLEEDRAIFASLFQQYYLRLAIFFGCLGMFLYLFRGEMANRTLHYWLLAPARRDVLLAGKYAAGLFASVVIFGGGALLAFAAMAWPHDAVQLQAYWNAGGMAHAFWYAAAAVLGCIGYGSVFLAMGLYVRNAVVPAAVLLAWEGAHGIFPPVLQKFSILYYLQSLCPVPTPIDSEAPTLFQLMATPAAPASWPEAVLGLLALTAFVLWIASRAVRHLQIAYGADT